MDFEILYWHWIVLGLVLVLGEMATATFFLLWFGVAAIAVGAAMLLIPLAPSAQIALWAAFSIALTLAWFKYLQPFAKDRTKAGLSLEAVLGMTGMVIKAPTADARGLIRFPVPVLGSDEWAILSQDALKPGERARVINVVGNALNVEKTAPDSPHDDPSQSEPTTQ